MKSCVLEVLLPALLLGALAPSTAAQREDSVDRGSFHIPIARTARFLAEEVEEHIAAERWSNAIAGLQKLIEDHKSEVLPSSFRPSANLSSDYPAHPGAAYWAERRLRSLPDDALELYRERYAPEARAALELALGRGDHALIAQVARRYPVTTTATRAWWILGDLELESGYPESALAAWELAVAFSDPAPPGASARLALARSRTGTAARNKNASYPPMPTAGRVPRGDADTWTREIDLSPVASGSSSYAYNIFPIIAGDAGDRVLVSNTHEVTCFDAFTGETLWKFGPPKGWDRLRRRSERELLEGIHFSRLLVAPAALGNVAVAALQIPYSRDKSHNWQNIEIIHSIPERRLFAFDLETGKLLWSHAPNLHFDEERQTHIWDESLSSYEERMLVAAPPTIAGTRVLVPSYRLQGRIDYQVACYDLFSGKRLWSTSLISGQRERNMFGRADKEFVASPVTVSGHRVIAQTELGTVAALDLTTGRILWESLYQQIPLRRNRSYETPMRSQVWRETAPVVANGVVIATPTDTEDLLAFDLEDGRVLWSQNEYFLRTRIGSSPETIDLLVGADEDSVYLAGLQLLVLQKPGGLRTRSSFVARRPDPLDDSRGRSHPRAILGPEEIIVPLRAERRVFDRDTLEPEGSAGGPWTSAERGNLVLGSGALFSLSRDRLTAYFAWDTLLARQRKLLKEQPTNPSVAVAMAEILKRRGTSLLENEGDATRSLRHFLEARKVLEPRLEQESGGMRHRLRNTLSHVLRGEARARVALPDRKGALSALDQALRLVTSPEDRRDTLFERGALLAERPLRERLTLWAQLESDVGNLPLPESVLAGSPDWLLGESLLNIRELEGWAGATLNVDLWVLLTRALAHAHARDSGQALSDLHLALASYGSLPLGTMTVGNLVSDRIARRLELDGRRAYAPFETAAETLLAEARAGDKSELFGRVSELYPHSQAANIAREALLEQAFATQNSRTIASLLYASDARRPMEQEIDALLRLGLVLEEEGNTEFLPGLLTSLASETPTLRVGAPGLEGRTLSELARKRTAEAPPNPHATATFGPGVGLGRSYIGGYRYLGETPDAGVQREIPRPPLKIYVGPEEVMAFGVSEPGIPRWTFPLPFTLSSRAPQRPTCTIGSGRVLVGSALGEGSLVLAIDAEGELAWSFAADRGRVESVAIQGGIALVQLDGPNRVVALEARNGTPLWHVDLDPTLDWRKPIVGEGKAIYTSFRHGTPCVGVVLDVFRGRVITELALGRSERGTEQSSWIRAGWLLVPRFGSSRTMSGITGFDLQSGARETLVEFGESEELASIVQSEGRDYLVAVTTGPQTRGRSGGVYAFDVGLRSLRSVISLRPGDRPMGIRDKERVELEEPFLFIYGSSSGKRRVQVQAVHLPYERRWVYSLPVTGEELHNDGLALPALSEDFVAFVFRTKRGGRRDEARLVFVDKNGGLHRDTRVLPPEFAADTRIEMHGHGRALILLGHNRDDSRIEILEEL